MKRLPVALAIILGFFAPFTLTAPATAETPTATNVTIEFYQNTNGKFVSSAQIYDPTVDDGSRACAPAECGKVVLTKVHKGKGKNKYKKAMVSLSTVPGETLVYGYLYFSGSGYSQGYYEAWDGSTTSVIRTIKIKHGKSVKLMLDSAQVGLYLEGSPVPPICHYCD